MDSFKSFADKLGSFGLGLSILAQGLDRGREQDIREAARVLEMVVENGLISRRWEGLALATSALAYDSIAETFRARKPYSKLLERDSYIPVSDVLLSSEELA